MSEEILKYNSPILESNFGIILSEYEKIREVNESYQTEKEMEDKLVSDLVALGYEYITIKNMNDLYLNLRKQIERLNKVVFSDYEWQRLLDEYINAPNDTKKEKTRKIQKDHIYDFKFNDGRLQNIKIIDKVDINNNFVQVTRQVSVNNNRYDVTILVNGLPLVQIELKKRGVSLLEAFNQINRYSSESFYEDSSLYKYIQIFVISNGTNTRYFANTTERSKNSYEFTCEWADAKNNVISDIVDFTATFLARRTLLEVLTKYCVFNASNILLIMRPYQIAATERILWKIRSSYLNKLSSKDAGGYIWHTTGSGKTLTSFKTAKLATELEYIDKVFFVVDRKDLDFQTMKEYRSFQEDSVNGSKNTKELKKSIEMKDSRIVVTTIQKLNEFIKKNREHDIYSKQCVFIFDECHRSQFGEAQNNIRKAFKKYYQFGFTGTPIFTENSLTGDTTASVFGAQLHSYVITDAIRDGKVLKFKVDYKNILPEFKEDENIENSVNLHSRKRINAIVKDVLSVYNIKTHRNESYSIKDRRLNGFNAMLAVENVEAAKIYYEELKKEQEKLPEDKKLKFATIFSFVANEEGEYRSKGEIEEENYEPSKLELTSKEFLINVIDDYNNEFGTSFSIEGEGFENYYKDLSKKVKEKEVDLLLVVGMFLTGFDAPTLNTLFVDKNLKYHGLIQAYSRTNRILNKVKSFGNIVCYRDLEQATKDAIKTFGDKNSINIILEKNYEHYIHKYINAVDNLDEKLPEFTNIELEEDKKLFVKLFNEIIKLDNVLKNFDEFVNEPKKISERKMQDMKSKYLAIKEEFRPAKEEKNKNVDDDLEFHIDLLKTDEINLDYILKIIIDKVKEVDNVDKLKDEVRRLIRSSMESRPKESLILEFIDKIDILDKESLENIVENFYIYARDVKMMEIQGLINDEKLKDGAERFIQNSIEKGEVIEGGNELNSVLPALGRRGGARLEKKKQVYEKIRDLVDIFIGI